MNIKDAFPDTYLVFDIETTGFSPMNNDIIQIGILEVEDREIIGYAHADLVNPNFPGEFIVPENITELTGITSDMVTDDGTSPGITIQLVAKKLRNNFIVTHGGIKFDKLFLEVNCRRFNTLAPRNGLWLDTAALYKAMQMNEMSLLSVCESFYEFGTKILNRRVGGLKYNLAHCCKSMHIDTADLCLHRADADCVATHRLFEALREELVI